MGGGLWALPPHWIKERMKDDNSGGALGRVTLILAESVPHLQGGRHQLPTRQPNARRLRGGQEGSPGICIIPNSRIFF